MNPKLKRRLKQSFLYPIYCRMRGWSVQTEETLNRSHTWAFNAGNTFSGNPKWLFIYVNKYRKDIDAYWICDSQKTVDEVRALGYKAYHFKASNSVAVQRRTGVYVVEQVKEIIPRYLQGVKLLNLYHGVGCKTVEKKVDYGFLSERIAQKYIQNNEYYQKNMLFLVTSPLMEEHFKKQCDLTEENIIRGGYPRCIYQTYFEKASTFDHDILKEKGLPVDTKIAAYVPTYRDNPEFDFWEHAIPDFPRLINKLEEQKLLLIFKIHPQMEKDAHYIYLKEQYKDCPYLLFWDNQKDFYEIFDKIDVGIVDYSSIFYDMMAGGVPHFIRYFFDYESKENFRGMVFDLKEMTCGKICETFDGFLEVLGDYTEDDASERERINELFWEYSDKDTMEHIVDRTLEFEPKEESGLPELYSFDIFDTLISRKVLAPEGIFYYVQEKMKASGMEFPSYLAANYPAVRAYCEANVREYYAKTLEVRKSDWREISFQEIFDRMAQMYGLSQQQTERLMAWELEAEYENCIPREKEIALVKELLKNGEEVVLISDMYLAKAFVQKLLYKADPVLAELPLFLSSEYGVQKTTNKLFLEVYKYFNNYNFREWTHFGDHVLADKTRPQKLGIKTVNHPTPCFNEYETMLTKTVGSYDSYLVAAALARFREGNANHKDYFAFAYISLYFVPYVYWAVHHAVDKGMRCLYFISRDGYHLKQIADAVIEEERLDIRTKYIYGSRRAWRIPSFIDDVDSEFFSNFGNFANVNSYHALLKALTLTEEQFDELFPGLSYVKKADYIDPSMRNALIKTIEASKEYRAFILAYAAEQRTIVEEYFRQEIDFSETFAFVEYWGRGYTQDCFARILQHTAGREIDVPYYYARSIYPSQGHYVRYNFTTNNKSLIFTEAIFANIPYKSIEEYQYENGRIVPEILPADCDMELHYSMDKCLALFAKQYLRLEVLDRGKLQKELYDFALVYFHENPADEMFAECLGSLIDSVTLYGEKQEFAPAVTEEMLSRIEKGEKVGALTRSVPMTLKRSDEKLAERFVYLTEVLPKEKKAQRAEDRALTNETRARLQEDRAAKKELRRLQDRALALQKKYDASAAEKSVEKKVLFIADADDECLWSIRKLLSDRKEIASETLELEKMETHPELLASAQWIILCRPAALFTMLKLRGETKLIQIRDHAFPFFREEIFNDTETETGAIKTLAQYRTKNRIDYLAVPSERQIQIFSEAGSWNHAQIGRWGTPATDVLFDEAYRKAAAEKLYELFPEAAGKKIILYLPYHRFRSQQPNILEMLDIEVLFEHLANEYVVVLLNNAPCKTEAYFVPEKLRVFARDLTEQMTARQLMCAADVIVGDYRSEFYEAALLKKPLYQTVQDADLWLADKPMLVPFEECRIAPVIYDAYDLINELKNCENYDYQKLEAFAEKYLTYCKGTAARQMTDELM